MPARVQARGKAAATVTIFDMKTCRFLVVSLVRNTI